MLPLPVYARAWMQASIHLLVSGIEVRADAASHSLARNEVL
jgi:hypothetical protein